MQDHSGRRASALDLQQQQDRVHERIERVTGQRRGGGVVSNPTYFAEMLASCFAGPEDSRDHLLMLSEITKGLERGAARLRRDGR